MGQSQSSDLLQSTPNRSRALSFMKHVALIPCLALAAALIAAPRDKKKSGQPLTQALQLPRNCPR